MPAPTAGWPPPKPTPRPWAAVAINVVGVAVAFPLAFVALMALPELGFFAAPNPWNVRAIGAAAAAAIGPAVAAGPLWWGWVRQDQAWLTAGAAIAVIVDIACFSVFG